MVTANIICRLARLLFWSTPLISTAHAINEGGGALRIFLYRVTDFLANKTTNVSVEAVANYISRGAAPRHKIIPIYNGVDLSKFQKKNINISNFSGLSMLVNRAPIILNVARLVEAKDHHNLLNAFKLFKQKYSDATLLIAGDGPLKHELVDLAFKLNVSQSTFFLGSRDDVAELMSLSDLFVLSSASEGFGLVLAEAMACELPVVSTECGGTTEVINGYGITVKPKDSQALCDAMEQTLRLSEYEISKRTEMAKINVHERFDLDLISDTWIDLYKKISKCN